MFLRQIYDDELAQAAYLVGCQRTGEAVVVDPERDVDRYLELAERHGLKIVAAAETHIHADFLSGARELGERGARLYLSGEGGKDWSYRWLHQRSDGGSYDHRLLRNADRFSIGGVELEAVHTPGHTPEHLSFRLTDRGGGADRAMGLFTGDFVFVGDVGRPDLLETAAGIEGVTERSARDLHRSAGGFLEEDDFLQVWPAHGAGSACGKALGAVPQSTVGYERRFNPALDKVGDGETFARFVLEGQPEPPLYFARMKRWNRDGVPLLGKLVPPRELDGRDLDALDLGAYTILDTRPWESFREDHLPGALLAPLGAAFHSAVGSYVEPEERILLIADTAQVGAVTRALVRIGLDLVDAYVTPDTLEQSRRRRTGTPEMQVTELRQRLANEDAAVLDVRRAAELDAGSIDPDAIQIAHTRLPRHLDTLPRDRPVFVHCASGARSALAVPYLRRAGIDAIQIAGGYETWAETERNRGAA